MSRYVALSLATAVVVLAACGSGDTQPDAAPTPLAPTTNALPTETSPPAIYVAKVKNILVGLPPTDAEIKEVTADPTKLAALIDEWMELPQYQSKMLRFFELAFQQTQVDDVDFADQTFPTKAFINKATTPLIVQNLTESFARTMLELVSQGRPLTDALTTRSYMMTPALMEFYAFLDSWQVDDAGKNIDRFRVAHPNLSITVTSAAPIPIEESLDPTSANYMHWYNPDLAKFDAQIPGCFTDPVVYDPATTKATGLVVQRILQGSLDGRKNPTPGGQQCPPVAGQNATVLIGDDFTAWRMVSTRAPKAGEAPTEFFDIPKLRAGSELVLQVPRVGFFSTPAFFANWQTNTSNQMRVTMNQTLIVALGGAVDGTDGTHPPSTPGLDAVHANQPACVSCHQTLDPTRSIFSSTFSWNYHNQTETAFATQPGMFVFQGVMKPVTSLDDFGATLATHPLFAQAWAEKLCFYANSRKCDTADPEFQRIVDVFGKSNHSWTTLVRELLSSPITTNAKPTKTISDEGEVIAVMRRDHLCAALDARLGFNDVCGLITTPTGKGAKQAILTITEIVSGLPSDGYGRGSIAPVLPNEPSLFYRAGTENICSAISQLVVDPAVVIAGAKSWASASPDAAIADFVQIIMALTPSDPRSAPSITALKGHFDASVKTGATPADALKSTFVVACLAPSSVSVGL